MPNDDRGGLIVRMPRELKRQIAIDAAERETNMNDIIVRLLAKHYKFAYEPTPGGRRRSPTRARPAKA